VCDVGKDDLDPRIAEIRAHYINANYVRGHDGRSDTYIACQGPTENTVAQFWEMIWEHKVKAIVMLTNTVEQGSCSVALFHRTHPRTCLISTVCLFIDNS
jgi:protein tyrosine phosphatase